MFSLNTESLIIGRRSSRYKRRKKKQPISSDDMTIVYHIKVNNGIENEVYVGITRDGRLKLRRHEHRTGMGHVPWPHLNVFRIEGPMSRRNAKDIERKRCIEYIGKGIPLANKRIW